MEENNKQSRLILIVLITCLTGLLFGFDSGIISGAIFIIKDRFSLSTEEVQLIVDAMLFGACAGAFIGGKLADSYGRRSVLLLVAYIFIIGSICSALALNTSWLLIGRLIIGIAIGIASLIAPLYLAEIAPARHRGKFLLFNNIAISAGMALAYLVTFFLNAEGAWRAMLVISIFPAILLGFGILILPESPRWMVMQGWLQDAKLTLIKLRGRHFNENEWLEIQGNAQKENSFHWNFIKNNQFWPLILLGLALALVEQTTGIDTILYYIPAIFDLVGISEPISVASFKIEITGLLTSILVSIFVDRIGRRKLLLAGLIAMLASLLTLAVILPPCTRGELPSSLLMIDLLTFTVGCFLSTGTLFWLIIAEIFPLKMRGLLMSLAITLNWLTVIYITSDSFGILEFLSPVATLWTHITICLLSLIIFYLFLPETKGCSLEKIEANWLAKKPLREIGTFS